ncbi:uncharacterized protein LOC122044498 [Zingiber officinale]|uniref:uncharacterized protein LOC122044498 n=1 Tax=Zingiber officinale TaxID=94328 RepID=UPI001C4D5479|nr:uncharacterized protein LOC122044498 [Zingiber officinale]
MELQGDLSWKIDNRDDSTVVRPPDKIVVCHVIATSSGENEIGIATTSPRLTLALPGPGDLSSLLLGPHPARRRSRGTTRESAALSVATTSAIDGLRQASAATSATAFAASSSLFPSRAASGSHSSWNRPSATSGAAQSTGDGGLRSMLIASCRLSTSRRTTPKLYRLSRTPTLIARPRTALPHRKVRRRL